MGFDYNNVKDRKLYTILSPLGFAASHVIYDYKVVGQENVPKDKPFILISNHAHVLDPVLLMFNAHRPIHFMSKKEAFEQNALLSWFLSNVNTFPVARGRNDKSAIEYAAKLIDTGHVIGVFPEGTRSKDLKPHEPKAGAALIARQTKADILPACVYTETLKGFRRKITIRFGKLIPYEELGLTDDSSTPELREAAKRMMDSVVALWEEGHCE